MTGAQGKAGPTGAMGAMGTMGLQGEPGADGARGPAGPPGASADAGDERGYGPGLWVACARSVDLIDANTVAPGQDGIKETFFSYRVTAYVGQDVNVQCEVALGSVETASSGGYFPAITTGATTAACSPSIDYPPTGSNVGLWSFGIVAGVPRATYKDPDPGTLDGHAESFGESDCTVLKNDDDGWSPSSLADAF